MKKGGKGVHGGKGAKGERQGKQKKEENEKKGVQWGQFSSLGFLFSGKNMECFSIF